jgi:hypothetical protein
MFRARGVASYGYDVARISLGLVLLTAAGLKASELATEPLTGSGIFTSFWLHTAIVEFETLLGVWMLTGLFQRQARYVAIVCFGIFSCLSLSKGLAGATSCGCFGTVPVNPWYSFTFNIIAIAALCHWTPRSRTMANFGSKRPYLAICLLASLGIGVSSVVLGSVMANGGSTSGQFGGDSTFVILEPETWLGTRFALLGHTDVDDHIAVGKWVVLLYHHDCMDCRKLIVRYQQRAGESANIAENPSLALLELPPYGDISEMPNSAESPFLCGRVTDDRKWFVQTPVELSLTDGVVRRVANASDLRL